MNKTLAIILILSISLLFLTGCGSDDSGSTTQTAQNMQSEPTQNQQTVDSGKLQPPALPDEKITGSAITEVVEEIEESEMDSNSGTFLLKEGWNMVSQTVLEEFDNEIYYGDERAQIMVAFMFNPNNKQYIRFSKENENEVQSFLESMNDNNREKYFLTVAVWIYAPKDQTVTLDQKQSRENYHDFFLEKSQSFDLGRGWNLISGNPLIINRQLKDIVGTCDIKSTYFFNPKRQEWEGEEWDETIENEEDDTLSSDFLNVGLAFRVVDDCQFNLQAEIDIPQIPSLPE